MVEVLNLLFLILVLFLVSFFVGFFEGIGIGFCLDLKGINEGFCGLDIFLEVLIFFW